MIDFTLEAYRAYLEALNGRYAGPYRFDVFLERPDRPDRFCLIRHDVDRMAERAVRMARLEHEMGVASTYYFRVRRGRFPRTAVEAVAGLGHEVGYHYEDLSDARGDHGRALSSFRRNLAALRTVVPVRTVAMHGRPLSRHDNRDLWRPPDRRGLLKRELGILGEVYLDVDYSGVAYLCDTGRTWHPNRGNLRDRVDGGVRTDVRDGRDLLRSLRGRRFPRLVFQVHPERWTRGAGEFAASWAMDRAAGLVKGLLCAGR